MGAFSKLFGTRKHRIGQAADQMWEALLVGTTFEVGSVLNTDADTTAAVMLLRKRHPDVVLTLQSRGWVLSRERTTAVSKEGWDHLMGGGYNPDNRITPQMFLDAHAQWMHRNDNTLGSVEDVVARSQRRLLADEMAKHSIVLPGFGDR